MLCFRNAMKTLVALLVSTLFLASCNTTIGLGRDLQKAGEGLSNTAQKAKPDKDGSSDGSQ